MTTPTPEQFLGMPSTEDDEDEVPSESAAAPQQVVESWTIPTGAVWEIPEPGFQSFTLADLTTIIEQIAADVRRIAGTTNVQHTTDGDRVYSQPITVYGTGDLSTPSFERVSDFSSEMTEQDELLQAQAEVYADVAAKHDVLLNLVAEIKAIVKPSSSKVSLEVKAAIERWANPVVDMSEGDQRLAEAQAAGEVVQPDVEPTAQTVQCERCAGVGCDSCNGVGQWEVQVGPLQQQASEPTIVVPKNGAVDVGPVQPEPTDHVEAWRAYAREVQPDAAWEGMNRSQIRTALGIAQPVAGA